MVDDRSSRCGQISPEIEKDRKTLKQKGRILTSKDGPGKVVSGPGPEINRDVSLHV